MSRDNMTGRAEFRGPISPVKSTAGLVAVLLGFSMEGPGIGHQQPYPNRDKSVHELFRNGLQWGRIQKNYRVLAHQ